MRYSAYRRSAAAVAAVLTCAALAPASTARAEETSEWRTPLTKAAMPTQVFAASGNSILAHVQDTYRLSTDFGATWKDVDPGLTTSATTADYVEDGWAAMNEWDRVVLVDLATGRGRRVDLEPLALTDGDHEPIVVTSDRDTLLWNGDQLVISHISDAAFGAPVAAVTNDLAAPSGVMYAQVDWSIDHSFAYRSTAYTNTKVQRIATDIDPIALDGSAGPAAFRVKGDVLHVDALDATHLEYFAHTTTAISRCVRDLSTAISTCTKVRTPSARRYPLLVQRQGDVVLLQDGKSWFSCQLSGTACVLGPVAVPKGLLLSSQYDGLGDPTEPLLGVSATAGATPVYALGPQRTLAKRFDPLVVPVQVHDLSFGVDRVVGMDLRSSRGVWQRPVGSDGIGAEKTVAAGGWTVKASAGRTAVDTGSSVAFYDRGTKVATGPWVQSLLGLSGPYPLVDRGAGWDVARYVGQPLGNYRTVDGLVRAVFGTRVLTGTDCFYTTMCGALSDGGPGTTLVVTDLADTGFRREIPLPAGIDPALNAVSAGFLWGDRVAVTFTKITESSAELALHSAVYDLVSGTWSEVQSGTTLYGLGDGYAISEEGSRYSAWDYDSNATYGLTDAEDASYLSLSAGVGAVAYATNSEIVLRRVPGAGQSAPRVLGVLASATCNSWNCSWSPEIDVTKGLDAGQLAIRTAEGVVIRTLQTPAAPDGSIRGVTWDGRLDDGSFAVPGTYTWQLEAPATDGSGAATAVDGTSMPEGTIVVTQKHLGKAKVSRVAISDTSPTVEQKLTSSVTVFPKDASLAYTWYAGSAVVGHRADYTVQPSDAGRKLKLVVSAQREGAYPASRTSATTKATAKARFTATKKPTLTQTGNVVTAEVPEWAPLATLSYQWYRVSDTASVKVGANSASYQLTSLDAGYKLRLAVTGSRPGFFSVTIKAITDVVSYTP